MSELSTVPEAQRDTSAQSSVPIYLDHNATTPVRPEVVDAMLPFLREAYANPNSVYSFGQRSRKAVEEARANIAALIGASADEIVFTASGTEADVMAVYGAAQQAYNRSSGKKNHVVSSKVEHEAVLGACRQLRSRGFKATFVGVGSDAMVSAEAVAEAMAPETSLVSIMLANNEVGAIQPVAEIADHCRRQEVVFHTDAVQAVGKIPVDARALGVDLLSMSGHKINAPKGTGALYIRKGVVLSQLISGKQEKNRRGGTENVASIVGFGVAAKLAKQELEKHHSHLAGLRDRLEAGVLALKGAHRTCSAKERLPGACHFCFDGVDGHNLVIALDLEGICVSSGSACAAGMTEMSHVLKAMGVDAKLGSGALRVSLGWGSTQEHVERFLEVLPRALEKLRRAA